MSKIKTEAEFYKSDSENSGQQIFVRRSTYKEIETQLLAVLAMIPMKDSANAKSGMEWINTPFKINPDSEIPEGNLYVSVDGYGEGLRLELEIAEPDGRRSPVVSVKYFASTEEVFQIAKNVFDAIMAF